jgi:hypothetical protein
VTQSLTITVLLAQAAAAPAVVTLTKPAPVTLAPGAKVEQRLTVTVKKGFHVQANPASEPDLIPLRLEMESDCRVRAARPIYPSGKPYRLAGAESDLSIYDGTFEIRLPLDAPRGAALGEVMLKGALLYQACNDRICLRPASVPVFLVVKVAGPGKPDHRF